MTVVSLESYPYNAIRFARINATSDGDNTVVTGTSGYKIRVLSYAVNANAAGVIAFQDSAGSPVVAASFELTDGGGVSFAGGLEAPAFEVASGLNLEINTAAGVDALGHVSYVLVKA